MPTTPIDRASVVAANSAAPAPRAAGSPWLAWALAGLAMFAAVLVLRVWRFSDDPNATICIFRRWTHHDCATCGMTRAMAMLVRGDLAGSFVRHPLAPPLAAEVVLLWLATPIAIVRGVRVTPRARDAWLLVHAAAFLLLWVVRLFV